jgi:ParB family chromosome partitioning protein
MNLLKDEIVHVPVADIAVGKRVRPLDENAVETISASVKDLGGIVTPIHLRKVAKGYSLIDGLHRLTVARRTNLAEVPALIWECREDEARFMEVDANLSIAHLQPIDVAVNLAARKASYEELYPDTRQGAAGAFAKNNLQRTNLSFAEYTAKVLGLSARQVRRVVAVGESVSPDEARWIRSAQKRANYSDLEAIGKTPPGHDRAQAIIRFSNGQAATLRAALKAIRPDAAPLKDPVEEAFKALCKAFERAPKAAQRRFVAAHARALSQLVEEVARDEQ